MIPKSEALLITLVIAALAVSGSSAYSDPVRVDCRRWEFCKNQEACIRVQGDGNFPSHRSFFVDEERKLVRDSDFDFYLEFKDLGSWKTSVFSSYFGTLRNAAGEILFKTREPQRTIVLEFSNENNIPTIFNRDKFGMKYQLEVEQLDASGDINDKLVDIGYCKKYE